MRQDVVRVVLRFVLGPLAVVAVTGALGAALAGDQRGTLFAATAKLTAAERAELELVPFSTVANAAWRLGSWISARNALKAELDHLPDSGAARARTLLRFGAVDRNPEGQAAIYGQACAADPSICDQLKEATEEQTNARLVSPGNRLPIYFGGHPPIHGSIGP